MTEKNQVYKCNLCGNIVDILHHADGSLICCGKEMELLVAQTADPKTEKHVPVLIDEGLCLKIKIGSTPHPMTEEHHIEWIEILNGDYVNRKYLNPRDKAEAEFYLHKQPGLIMRSYCNIHGLWKAE